MTKRRLLLALATLAIVLSVWLPTLFIVGQTSNYVFRDSSKVPARRVALVLGAGLNQNGTPITMLADRLDGSFALLRSGRVRMLLFSGDNSSTYHNEPAAMLTYALRHNIPRDRIVLDYGGFDTYDSCYRAAKIFGVRSVIVVTQVFHINRAVYLCRSIGIDTVGFGLADWGIYDRGLMIRMTIREWLARLRALIDIKAHRVPKVL